MTNEQRAKYLANNYAPEERMHLETAILEALDQVERKAKYPETDVTGAMRHLAFRAAAEGLMGLKNWGPMNSAHEAYAVMLEEVDELWDHVKTKQKLRDLEAMEKEAVQIAAMALRFANECCNETVGRK